jgi:hypothetical protein
MSKMTQSNTKETKRYPIYPWFVAAIVVVPVFWFLLCPTLMRIEDKLFPPVHDYPTHYTLRMLLFDLYQCLKLSCGAGMLLLPIAFVVIGLTQKFWRDPANSWLVRLLPMYLLLAAVALSIGGALFFMLMAG